MATVDEVKVTGRKYRLWDAVNSIWKRVSYWTAASDVEFEDGLNLEDKVSEINTDINELSEDFSNALADLQDTDISRAVGADRETSFPAIANLFREIRTYLNREINVTAQVGSTYTIPIGYFDGTSTVTGICKPGAKPGTITTNGTHSTDGYESMVISVPTVFDYNIQTATVTEGWPPRNVSLTLNHPAKTVYCFCNASINCSLSAGARVLFSSGQTAGSGYSGCQVWIWQGNFNPGTTFSASNTGGYAMMICG